MHIAILGSTSQIARDLISFFDSSTQLYLFCRDRHAMERFISAQNLSCSYQICEYDEFTGKAYDAVINFVGSGDPAKTASLGAQIFDITQNFDSLAMKYLESNPECKYIFFSSGAAFGSVYDQALDVRVKAIIDLNNLGRQDWYGVAKLHAECRHRARPDLSIIDLRIFSYFSRLQDINARFLLSDIAKSILNNEILSVSKELIYRDYIHPSDLYGLIILILCGPKLNAAIDCYSKEPVSKLELIDALKTRYGLRVKVSEDSGTINATGSKTNYYSQNRRARLLGYGPKYDSLGGIVVEMDALLSLNSFSKKKT